MKRGILSVTELELLLRSNDPLPIETILEEYQKAVLALEKIRITQEATHQETAYVRAKIAEQALGYMP